MPRIFSTIFVKMSYHLKIIQISAIEHSKVSYLGLMPLVKFMEWFWRN